MAGEGDSIFSSGVKGLEEREPVSAVDQLKQVTDYLTGLASTPGGNELLLQAVRTSELRQGLLSELVRETILRLSARSRRMLEADGILQERSWRDWLWVVVVGCFAIVLVGSFLALAFRVLCKPTQNDVAGQMLLTMFSTSVGFLSGLFAPNSSGHGSSPKKKSTLRVRRAKPAGEANSTSS